MITQPGGPSSEVNCIATYPELLLHPRSLRGVRYPHPSLDDTYQPGCTEPWVAQLVSSLLIASGGRTVLETGGFQGTTSAWLALALESMGGGMLHVCEIDHHRADMIRARLDALPAFDPTGVRYTVHCDDVMQVIHSLPNDYLDLVWLDDDHQQAHVDKEISLLWPKMKQGGLIVGHDVYGVCDLRVIFQQYGGYSIDLPRLGPAGGIGILQKP